MNTSARYNPIRTRLTLTLRGCAWVACTTAFLFGSIDVCIVVVWLRGNAALGDIARYALGAATAFLLAWKTGKYAMSRFKRTRRLGP